MARVAWMRAARGGYDVCEDRRVGMCMYAPRCHPYRWMRAAGCALVRRAAVDVRHDMQVNCVMMVLLSRVRGSCVLFGDLIN